MKDLRHDRVGAKLDPVTSFAMTSTSNSNIIDLSKVSAVLKTLENAKSAELASLWVALENFKQSVGPDLNKAELRQLMIILFNDQIVTEPPNESEKESLETVQELMNSELSTISGGASVATVFFKQPVTMLKTGNFTLRAVI